MPANCLHRNPLLHSGTAQWGRVLQALHPSFARVDERNAADLILFAREYSQYLQYYNQANEADGNWLPLMRMDLSVSLASLSSQRVPAYLSLLRRELAFLSDRHNLDEASLKQHFSFLFDFAFSWMYELDTQCRQLPDAWPFKSWLTDTIRATLAAQRYRLSRYLSEASTAGLIVAQNTDPGMPLPFRIEQAAELQTRYWQPCWDYTPDQPFEPKLHGTTPISRIRNTAVHNLFTGILDTIFKQAASISRNAGLSLEESLTGFPQHTPHYALLLTFIRLFRFAQDQLNGFTQRHLNLYYKDILQLRPRKPEPDYAHLLLTLQKNVQQHLLPAGTLFKAGKDALGRDMHYAATRDVVLNNASVAAIKSVLAAGKKSGSRDYQSVYAAPFSNSADGQGAPIKGDDQSWPAFGPVQSANLATFGFAIASHMLFMQEGSRTITLTFEAAQNLPADNTLYSVKPTIELSGEKGWEPALVTQFQKDNTNARRFILQCRLTPKAPAIVPFDAAIHDEGYQTPYPLMRASFKSTAGFNAWQLWSRIDLNKVILNVQVSGLKKLMVKNDQSVLDTSRPFMPFGATPYAGSALIIGSREIFQKEQAQVTLRFEWDKVPQPEGIISHMSRFKNGVPEASPVALHDTTLNYEAMVAKAGLSQLSDGAWSGSGTPQLLFSSREMFGNTIVDHIPYCAYVDEYRSRGLFTSYPETSFGSAPPPVISFTVGTATPPGFEPDEAFSNDSVQGFVRLSLNIDLGHKDFIQRFTELSASQKKPPLEPYTPLASGLTAAYTASQELNFQLASATAFSQKKWQFFSRHPFGQREEHRFPANTPRFSITPDFDAEGSLMIGLAGALPDTSVQLLFQLSEGSANPMRSRQEVIWQYLARNNHWKTFEDGQVTDDSNGLLHSGIISFALPADIASAPSLMGGAHHWIRARVLQSSDAICRIIAIHAQAIKTVWTNNGNEAIAYSQMTPAGTISKLLLPNAAIKKTEQPYDSFGGRLPETDEHYYLRSSERLRHKRRAITIWDYERLVLEAFPQIYKVKCLNHTRVRLNNLGDETGDNELAPGCVVVVPIPDLSRMHSPDPLRPLTSLDTLTEIESYLKAITSGHVRLQLRNPVFEEVVIQSHVQFRGNDPAFYRNQLLEDLQRFMCPWAYDTRSDISFGGKISKSTLIDFIEELPYVDYLTRFKMYRRVNNVTMPQDLEEISASTARSILVIARSNLHYIQYLKVSC